MRAWVAVGILSLQASLSLAAELPEPATHSTFPKADLGQVLLGQKLFYDPILSGNQTIACATCHHPSLGTGDGMSLSIGEGGQGLGPDRQVLPGEQIHARIPRNAPALWNLGAQDFRVMFHDGRVMLDANAPFGVRMPPNRALLAPVNSVLAAQAMLPVLSADEMAGHPGENPVADAVQADDAPRAWTLLSARVASIPEYRARFDRLIGAETELQFTDIANAIAAFISYEFRATDSAFDRYLQGDDTALSAAAQQGMELFYGDAGCAGCHAGLFQTDQDFHAIGVPQIGPGKGGDPAYSDAGRYLVTQNPEDTYRFRTPSLRNVALTAPYGHSGAYPTLLAMLLHHLGPVDSLMTYDRAQARLHPLPLNDWQAMEDEAELFDIAAGIELPTFDLNEEEVLALLAFLEALSDPSSAMGRLGVPENLPSGLPLDR